MEKDSRQLKRSLTRAVAGICLLLLAATGTTFAWFTITGEASTNVTPTGGTISSGDTTLLISANADGPFEETCNLIPEGTPETLKPVSTADPAHFYRATAQNREGISVLYANADQRVDTDTLHGTIYLKCENASCRVYFNQAELKLGSDAQALAAMRLAMRITSHAGTKTHIWKLDDLGNTGGAESKQTISESLSVVSSISQSGQPVYTADPAGELSAFFAEEENGTYRAGTESVTELNDGEVAAAEYWIYLEGCDEQCINAVQSRTSDIQFAFVGVDITDN